MAEELEAAWSKFTLYTAEKREANLEERDVKSRLEECKRSLIGKVVGDKLANYTGIKNIAKQIWGAPRNLKVTEIAPNMFQFFFSSEQERNKVLRGRPWNFDGQLMVLKQWQEDIEEDEEAFKLSQIWVQVGSLPLHWVSKEAGKKVGKIFEKVIEVLVPQGGGKDGNQIKLLVEMDTTKPIPRGSKVKLNRKVKWINFRYERLPEFCFCCGIIGHTEKHCSLLHETNSGGEYQFGNWLRAGGGKRTGDKEKEGSGTINKQPSVRHEQVCQVGTTGKVLNKPDLHDSQGSEMEKGTSDKTGFGNGTVWSRNFETGKEGGKITMLEPSPQKSPALEAHDLFNSTMRELKTTQFQEKTLGEIRIIKQAEIRVQSIGDLRNGGEAKLLGRLGELKEGYGGMTMEQEAKLGSVMEMEAEEEAEAMDAITRSEIQGIARRKTYRRLPASLRKPLSSITNQVQV